MGKRLMSCIFWLTVYIYRVRQNIPVFFEAAISQNFWSRKKVKIWYWSVLTLQSRRMKIIFRFLHIMREN